MQMRQKNEILLAYDSLTLRNATAKYHTGFTEILTPNKDQIKIQLCTHFFRNYLARYSYTTAALY